MESIKLFQETEIPEALQKVFQEISKALVIEKIPAALENQNYLHFSEKGLAYWDEELGELHLDFLNDKVNYARKSHQGKSELIAKAVGLPKGVDDVFDATMGLAQDAWFLTRLGAKVRGCERSPVLFLLLKDALRRAQEKYPQVTLEIEFADSISYLKQMSPRPAVVFVDPMFPEKKKSALPKKEMRIFRKLVGDDLDSGELLDQALKVATERVVVKRPNKAEPLSPKAERASVMHTFEGKTVRYDLYSTKAEKSGKGLS